MFDEAVKWENQGRDLENRYWWSIYHSSLFFVYVKKQRSRLDDWFTSSFTFHLLSWDFDLCICRACVFGCVKHRFIGQRIGTKWELMYSPAQPPPPTTIFSHFPLPPPPPSEVVTWQLGYDGPDPWHLQGWQPCSDSTPWQISAPAPENFPPGIWSEKQGTTSTGQDLLTTCRGGGRLLSVLSMQEPLQQCAHIFSGSTNRAVMYHPRPRMDSLGFPFDWFTPFWVLALGERVRASSTA